MDSARIGDVDGSLRSLMLLRHTKSSWADAGLDDHDRPLAPRGEKALPRLRRYVTAKGLDPSLVLCSTARRTVMTWDGVRTAFPADTVVRIESGLYAASASRLLARLRDVDDAISGVLVIAHNPGLHDLAVTLTGDGDRGLREELASAFPTGALATFTFAGAWSALGPGAATLVDFAVPRELP